MDVINALNYLELAAKDDYLNDVINEYTNEELREIEMALYDRESIILVEQISNLNSYDQYLVQVINDVIRVREYEKHKKERESIIKKKNG